MIYAELKVNKFDFTESQNSKTYNCYYSLIKKLLNFILQIYITQIACFIHWHKIKDTWLIVVLCCLKISNIIQMQKNLNVHNLLKTWVSQKDN